MTIDEAMRQVAGAIDGAIDWKLSVLEDRLRTEIGATGEALDPDPASLGRRVLGLERSRLMNWRDLILDELHGELNRDLNPATDADD